LKSGSLNHLEPSGPVQACNGIALPFFTYKTKQTQVTVTIIITMQRHLLGFLTVSSLAFTIIITLLQ
jgi:hypothetical protein